MNKPSLKNNGFAHLAVVLVVAVVIIIGGIGGYVYHKDHKSKPATVSSNTNSSTGSSQQSGSSTSTTKSPVATAPTNPYAGWKTYTSKFGNFSIKYPTDWRFLEFDTTNADLQYYTPFIEVIDLAPKTAQASTVNSFLMELGVTKDATYTSSASHFYTSGGTATTLTNGIQIWQSNASSAILDTRTCPLLDIISRNQGQYYSTYNLGGGQYLAFRTPGSYCNGQRATTTLSYQQQLASQSWQDAIKILQSIKVQ